MNAGILISARRHWPRTCCRARRSDLRSRAGSCRQRRPGGSSVAPGSWLVGRAGRVISGRLPIGRRSYCVRLSALSRRRRAPPEDIPGDDHCDQHCGDHGQGYDLHHQQVRHRSAASIRSAATITASEDGSGAAAGEREPDGNPSGAASAGRSDGTATPYPAGSHRRRRSHKVRHR